MTLRTTRVTLEALGRGNTDALRVSRVDIEVVGHAAVNVARVSRVGLEVLGEQVVPWLRTTRVGLEVLGHAAVNVARVSRVGLEVLGEQVVPWLRTTRVGLEVLGEQVAPWLRTTRVGLEVLGDPVYLWITRVGLEVLGGLLTPQQVPRQRKRIPMLILQAPLPGLTTTTILPNPEFNDAQAKQHGVTIQRTMDGGRFTYVHTTDSRYKLTYQINMTRMKALELRAFVQAYYRSRIRLTNHKGEVWTVWFVNNPFEFETLRRAGSQPGGELVSLTIECEGFLAGP